ncbi:MAG: carbamoyltransferase HypF [Comamonadaceae bacterium CG1_02_60_18]|nr:MAG: carbamoyltransferase HypF [Comamonadaceae bacterium CG1_02_60_18]PIQ50737.1 MAG: carbamoyltransferase HypF [Comamonadaceae bacterium CG12_big_fil_rev_8_21_14_0_65_59_15]
MKPTLLARRIRVTGVVQGVGFRPFVWRLAHERALCGWVRNDALGVEIAVQGAAHQVEDLLLRLRSEAPPLARVDTVQARDTDCQLWQGFQIVDSAPGLTQTAIGPDVAVCDACLQELFDPANRRWRHPFITCTHCGPRLTVTRALPYDRPQTSMAGFDFCPDCAREYTTPADRRFHAETTCCPLCGPGLTLSKMDGSVIAGDAIAQTLALLQRGAIVAIKGLGGFHLACDARDADAVSQLRQRKQRDAKPLAVMVANVASLHPYAHVSSAQQAALESRERPIVLLRTQPDCASLLQGIAPGLDEVGVLLPTTPMHYLLFHEAAGRPAGCAWLQQAQPLVLVMTSANPGGEPIVRDAAEARVRLADIADALLDHDREVVLRCDDSVLRVHDDHASLLRRSRGFAPTAIRLPQAGPSVLALGSHLKNTICVTRDNEAFLSPHVGSLDNAATCDYLDETVQRMVNLLDVHPELIAHDLHPDDYSTRAAQALAQRFGVPTQAVQHHHAHIAAVCAEHGWQAPVLGLALDGFGLGSDGGAWGGELLYVHGGQCARLGSLRALGLPGGDRAAREPWRMAAAVLHALGRNADISTRFAEPAAATVAGMLQRGFNSPPTSSMGRLFDAAAALLGLCNHSQYESQAAIVLEQAAARHIQAHGWPPAMPGGWALDDNFQLDFLPVLATLLNAQAVDFAAARFHATLIAGLVQWLMRAVEHTGVTTVALAGGCLHNALLSAGLAQQGAQRGLNVLRPTRTSPGDASISLGQAWVAMQSLE